ncbi:hypothetical protein B0T14DRAFT_308563 [Immersiella caudata]|uniref:Deoxyribonuclease NucA/NucB domain-containing protein n=1 Tax=Immersiella caudata TaxID=314043 RepID=A0AA39WFE4_9PEZI|nr:hypothetical protein B0T14DRAFT_308563 [Immersiella caudata]
MKSFHTLFGTSVWVLLHLYTLVLGSDSLLLRELVIHPLGGNTSSIFSTASSSFLTLDERQLKCPAGYPVPCPGGVFCTQLGRFCCPSNQAVSCPTGGTCCTAGCADPGNTCCGTKGQCLPTEQCCSGGGGCATKTGTCCGAGHYCTAGARCCKDADGDSFCSPAGAACFDTMTLDFADYPGMDEIFENMCRGMLRSGQKMGSLNEIILTYIGPRRRSEADKNRRDAGCKDSVCARLFSGGGVKFQCDEFPFATSMEGGAKAAMQCVSGHDNRVMGSRWGTAVRGKTRGTRIRVKIKGFDCGSVGLEKRAAQGAVLKNETTAIYVDGKVYGEYSEGKVAMIVPLDIPDDFVGTFTVSYTIASGEIKSGYIMDGWGEDYGRITIRNSGKSATGVVEVGPEGVGNVMMLAWADDTDVSVKYTTSLATATPTSRTATGVGPAATFGDPTATSGTGRAMGGIGGILVGAACIVSVSLFL